MPQILPSLADQMAKLERRLAEMPAGHPKRAAYEAQLDGLRRIAAAEALASRMPLEELQRLAGMARG